MHAHLCISKRKPRDLLLVYWLCCKSITALSNFFYFLAEVAPCAVLQAGVSKVSDAGDVKIFSFFGDRAWVVSTTVCAAFTQVIMSSCHLT